MYYYELTEDSPKTGEYFIYRSTVAVKNVLLKSFLRSNDICVDDTEVYAGEDELFIKDTAVIRERYGSILSARKSYGFVRFKKNCSVGLAYRHSDVAALVKQEHKNFFSRMLLCGRISHIFTCTNTLKFTNKVFYSAPHPFAIKGSIPITEEEYNAYLEESLNINDLAYITRPSVLSAGTSFRPSASYFKMQGEEQ